MTLTISHLDVSLGTTLILSAANLHVEGSQIVALQGPSGSGKSTLLRAIAGLIPIDRGTILWDDIELHRLPTHLRQVGLVFQDRVLFPHLDVAGNIGFGLKYSSMPKGEKARRIDQLLELVSLEGFRKRGVSTLSGGQAQRVALARALAPRPRVLLLDEPLTALDESTKDQLRLDVRATLKAEQVTAIYVTHDFKEAEAVADRTVNIEALTQNHGRTAGFNQ